MYSVHVGYGSRLGRYALVSHSRGEHYSVLVTTHAIFDAWTFGHILRTLSHLYKR